MIKTPGTTITHPTGGVRVVATKRPGGAVVVARGTGGGYVQRPFKVGNRPYVQRTYLVGGAPVVVAYSPVLYRSLSLNFYLPGAYYPFGLYSWAAGPWGAPVDYAWGWGNEPWFGVYGSYFRPWGVYRSPSFWLTDYVIANSLQSAYQARAEALSENAADEPVETAENAEPMSDDVKDMIEAEVRKQLAEAQAESQSDGNESRGNNTQMPAAFTDKGSHLLVANDTLEVENATTGDTCLLRGGDAILMSGGLPRSGTDVSVTVRASKGSNCAVNSTVLVPLNDLVEMHNNMRETIDRGLGALRERQGIESFPLLPPEAAGEPIATAFSRYMEPDPNAAEEIADVSRDADKLEAMTKSNLPPPVSFPPRPTPALPEDGLLKSIQNGQTESQVSAILGSPLNTSFLGGVKKIHEYRAGKVIFTDGEVSEVMASAPSSPAQVIRNVDIDGPGHTAPARPQGNITMGMTEDEVKAAIGPPLRVSFLGGLKKMYEYRERKVIFTDGNVSELQ